MKITFIANYMTHHQKPFADAMFSKLGDQFTFIQLEKMSEERVNLGWKSDFHDLPYLIDYNTQTEKKEEVYKRINECDILINGGTPEQFIEDRIKNNNIIFRYDERLFKTGRWKLIFPRNLYIIYKCHFRNRKKNMFMLSTGKYCADDLKMCNLYQGKLLKWGYFPKTNSYNIDEILHKKKQNNPLQLLWVGRLIDWKHPELVISLAKKLKKHTLDFHITMIGDGVLKSKLSKLIEKNKLETSISMLGAVSSERIPDYMEKSNILLATSDYQEGWGAVINEGMNCGCVVIASKKMGAATYLIEDTKNGILFNGGQKDLYKKVRSILLDLEKQQLLGRNAYETIINTWNAENAAERFIQFSSQLLQKHVCEFNSEGPLSEA